MLLLGGPALLHECQKLLHGILRQLCQQLCCFLLAHAAALLTVVLLLCGAVQLPQQGCMHLYSNTHMKSG